MVREDFRPTAPLQPAKTAYPAAKFERCAQPVVRRSSTAMAA